MVTTSCKRPTATMSSSRRTVTTILCIEDEALLLEDIVEELEDDGYDVLEAVDGREGLEMMVKHEPDLVICDVTMPHINGHDLVKTLREKHPQFADTPFIFLSALADQFLNLVKTLVEMHGGSIAIESKKGEGSTLTVHLPVDGPEETEESVSQAA